MERSAIAEIEWAVERARSGAPTLSIAGRPVLSRYDPARDVEAHAARMLRAAREGGARSILLIGSGLGDLPTALRAGADVPVAVWEPFPALAEAARDAAQAAPPKAETLTSPAACEHWLAAIAPRGPVHLAVHPGYADVARFEVRFALRALRVRAGSPAITPERAVVNERSLVFLADGWRHPTVGDLGACLDGHTALVVAPGPSLTGALPLLRERRGGVVIAAVQALRTLREAGVRVDFTVAPDPRDYTACLEGVDDARGVLLAEACVDPALVDAWPGQVVRFAIRSPFLHQVVWERWGESALDEPFVSVSETAMVLAQRLGARRFWLLGVDLASDDPRYPLRFDAAGAAGRRVTTNAPYFHAARYLGWLAPRLADAGCELIREPSGLDVPGTRPPNADDAAQLDRETPFCFEPPADLPHASRRKRVAQALRRAQRRSREAGPEALVSYERKPLVSLAPLWGDSRRGACDSVLRALGR